MKRWVLVAAMALAAVPAAPAQGADRVERGGDGKFVFGVVPQQQLLENDYRAISHGRVRSLRLPVYWPRVEPEPGRLDWSGYDVLVGQAARRGITVLPYLYGSPGWSARFDGVDCTSDCSRYAPRSPGTRAAFAFFASEAVRQYGPGGRYWAAHPGVPYRPIGSWQVWNEQNSAKYFAPEPDVAGYAALLERTAGAIRSVDPGSEIILGGMWGPDGSKEVVPTSTYLNRLYEQPGASGSFDSLALHPYSSGVDGMLAQIRSARSAARRGGEKRPALWITELGWASDGPAGHYLVKGRRGQAEILRDSYSALLERSDRWRLRGAYWYAWEDTAPTDGFICLWCPGAGLRSASGEGKPAWRSMKRLTRRR